MFLVEPQNTHVKLSLYVPLLTSMLLLVLLLLLLLVVVVVVVVIVVVAGCFFSPIFGSHGELVRMARCENSGGAQLKHKPFWTMKAIMSGCHPVVDMAHI